MATLAQLRSRVSAKLGTDPTASGSDETLVDGWLNEGVIEVLLQTGCKVISGTMSLVAGTKDYDLDTGILAVKHAYITASSQDYRMEQVSPHELIDMRLRGSNAQSSPALYYAVEGSHLFMVYPTPAAADTVTLYYVPRPTAMSSGAHDPSNTTYGGVPAEMHKAIEYYALWQGADYQNDETSGQGERYRQMFDAEIKKQRRWVNSKGNVRLPRAVVGRRRPIPRDPSTDVRW